MADTQPFLRDLAGRYYWWGTVEEALRVPNRLIALVMDIGDWEDTSGLAAVLGEERMRGVLKEARPGWFNARSWSYWHYRLGLDPAAVPPKQPRRSFS